LNDQQVCERTCTYYTAPICNNQQWCSGNQPTTSPGLLDCGAGKRCTQGGACVTR
jgi:hypothetical protein